MATNDYITAGIEVIPPKFLWGTAAEYPIMRENLRNVFKTAGMGHGLAFIGMGLGEAGRVRCCTREDTKIRKGKRQNAKCKNMINRLEPGSTDSRDLNEMSPLRGLRTPGAGCGYNHASPSGFGMDGT
jgi:hypothetical protein